MSILHSILLYSLTSKLRVHIFTVGCYYIEYLICVPDSQLGVHITSLYAFSMGIEGKGCAIRKLIIILFHYRHCDVINHCTVYFGSLTRCRCTNKTLVFKMILNFVFLLASLTLCVSISRGNRKTIFFNYYVIQDRLQIVHSS